MPQSYTWGRIAPQNWSSLGLTSFAERVLVGNELNRSLLLIVRVYHMLGCMNMSRANVPRDVNVSFS